MKDSIYFDLSDTRAIVLHRQKRVDAPSMFIWQPYLKSVIELPFLTYETEFVLFLAVLENSILPMV